jgi:hypothetical protein
VYRSCRHAETGAGEEEREVRCNEGCENIYFGRRATRTNEKIDDDTIEVEIYLAKTNYKLREI